MAFDFFRARNTGVVDLGVQAAGNWMMTGKAAESPDLRWSWRKNGENRTLYSDYRFGSTLLGLAGHTLAGGSSMLGRASYSFAAMSAHSLTATERIRRASMQQMNNAGGAQPNNQGTLAPPVSPEQLTGGAGAPTGSAFARFGSLAGSYG